MSRRHQPVWFAVAALAVLVAVVFAFERTAHEPAAVPAGSDPPETRAHAHHAGSVLIIGDSLTQGAEKAGLTKTLTNDGWQVEIDAEEGRSTRTGIEVVGARGSVPELVVVELGTNPSSAIGSFSAEITQMIDELTQKGATRVVWVTPHHRDDNRYDDKDRAIEDAAAADNRLVVADWHAYAAGHREWMIADGLHYTPQGYAMLAAFIADAIDVNAP